MKYRLYKPSKKSKFIFELNVSKCNKCIAIRLCVGYITTRT